MASKNFDHWRRYDRDQDPLVTDFLQAVSHLLQPNEFKGTALYKFLVGMARRWHLSDVDIDDVLLEAVKRGIEYIRRNGRPIEKPEAWLRRVCLNILKAQVNAAIKAEQRQTLAAATVQQTPHPLEQSELIEQLEYLEAALNRLTSQDQALIRMRFLQRQSYGQIRRHYELTAPGQPAPSEQTLRKRESRALQRLRLVFFELYRQGDRCQR
jgi:RNA polymerase sigma factor (sigma-70 family)